MILADANIWIDYFRRGEPLLQELLEQNQIVMHSCLAAELALGSLRDRSMILARLDVMPQARVVHLSDIRQMIESRRIYAKGIGLTDAHLLASCLVTTGTQLWTRDKALGSVAEALRIRAGLP